MNRKPKILVDIKSGKLDLFNSKHNSGRVSGLGRLNERLPRLPGALSAPMALFLALSFTAMAVAPIVTPGILAETSSAVNPIQEQQALEAQLQAYEDEIAALQNKIGDSRKQGLSLQGEINLLNNQIAKINLQIKAVTLSINKLKNELDDTNNEITTTESNIDRNKTTLTSAIQKIYYSDNEGVLEILLKSKQLSDFFSNVNNLTSLQANLRTALEDLGSSRDQLVAEKAQLDLQKADAEATKAYQANHQAQIQQIKKEKAILLSNTKSEQAQYEILVAQKKQQAAEIRSRIFRLMGGGELQFGDAVKLAQVAEKATGVRAALTLAVLGQESSVDGVIGKNLGRCYYNTPARNAAGTVMSNVQKPIYLALLSELGSGYDPNTTPVSCPIYSDGAYGGAMGPAQFMPVTWDLYKNRIAQITGGNPPNPFNNLDAFTATALYLSDGMQGCKAIYSTTFSRENCAAAKYYAGGSWRSYTLFGRYGYRVAEMAQQLQGDIDVLTSN